MELIKVDNPALARRFADVARTIYQDDPVWVCPPDRVIGNIFDPAVNPFHSHGEAVRWILKDGEKLIGRVAAFINHKKANAGEYPVGGMGFFECIDDSGAANTLFDACRNWLTERGIKAMDGPINFGENDNFWGLLVEGFTHPGFGMNYNPPYYQKLFSNYGFRVFYTQVTKHLNLREPFQPRYFRVAQWVLGKPEYTFRPLEIKHLQQFASDFKTVYDDAWRWHENFTPINIHSLIKTFRDNRQVIDPGLIWFAYQNEIPVGFFVVFPDLNQLIKPFRGKLGIWQKIQLLYRFRRHSFNRARIIIFGVAPRVQRYGIEAGLIWHLNEAFKKRPWYNELEISWVGDFNPKMQAMLDAVGGTKAKVHQTLRKLFDESLTFRAAKEIPADSRHQGKESM